MNRLLALFGALGLDVPKPNRSLGRESSLLLSDILLIVGLGLAMLLVLAFAIYLWMKFRRNRRKHVSGGEKVFRGSVGSDEDSEIESGTEDDDHEDDHEHEHEHGADEHDHSHDHRHHGRRKYKYRVRRRTHRSRNPTLSETGGLPPAKSQEPTKPC